MGIINKIENILFKNSTPYSLNDTIPMKFHKFYLVLQILAVVFECLSIAGILMGSAWYLDMASSAVVAAGVIGAIIGLISAVLSIALFIGLKGFRKWGYILLYINALLQILYYIRSMISGENGIISGLISLIAGLIIIYLILLYYYRRRALFFGEPEVILDQEIL